MGIRHAEEASTLNSNTTTNDSSANRNQHFMLVCDAYLVECPKEIITSWVRLEPAKERLDFLGDVLGPSESVCHLTNTPSEGESGEFGINAARGDGYGVPSIVESVPKVLHHVSGDIGNGRWKFLGQLDLVHLMVRLIRVRLNNSCVWIDSRELYDLPIKISKVFLSPRDFSS